MTKVIMLCGKICSGKSTYAEQLKKKIPVVVLSCDELMLSLFDEQLGDKHNFVSKKCQNYLLELAEQIVQANTNVILDFGFWNKLSRFECKQYFLSRNINTELHYIKIDKGTWLENIQKRNKERDKKLTKCYYVDENMQQIFDEVFEEPDESEIDYVVDNANGSSTI